MRTVDGLGGKLPLLFSRRGWPRKVTNYLVATWQVLGCTVALNEPIGGKLLLISQLPSMSDVNDLEGGTSKQALGTVTVRIRRE